LLYNNKNIPKYTFSSFKVLIFYIYYIETVKKFKHKIIQVIFKISQILIFLPKLSNSRFFGHLNNLMIIDPNHWVGVTFGVRVEVWVKLILAIIWRLLTVALNIISSLTANLTPTLTSTLILWPWYDDLSTSQNSEFTKKRFYFKTTASIVTKICIVF